MCYPSFLLFSISYNDNNNNKISFHFKRPLSTSYGYSYDSLEEVIPCYERKCTLNEHCCPGSICMNVDGGNYHSSFPRR